MSNNLLVIALIIGLVAAFPYIVMTPRRLREKPDILKCLTIIVSCAGAITASRTGFFALYYGYQKPDELGILQGDIAIIFAGAIAIVWVSIIGIIDVYRPVLAKQAATDGQLTPSPSDH